MKGSVRIPCTAGVFFIEVPSLQFQSFFEIAIFFEIAMRNNLLHLPYTFNYIVYWLFEFSSKVVVKTSGLVIRGSSSYAKRECLILVFGSVVKGVW